MKLSKQQKLAALLPLIRLAGESAPALSATHKADIFDGIAIITRGLDDEMHRSANLAAQCIRDAEAHQLTFTQIIQGKEAA
jgi:hypothetical protein